MMAQKQLVKRRGVLRALLTKAVNEIQEYENTSDAEFRTKLDLLSEKAADLKILDEKIWNWMAVTDVTEEEML